MENYKTRKNRKLNFSQLNVKIWEGRKLERIKFQSCYQFEDTIERSRFKNNKKSFFKKLSLEVKRENTNNHSCFLFESKLIKPIDVLHIQTFIYENYHSYRVKLYSISISIVFFLISYIYSSVFFLYFILLCIFVFLYYISLTSFLNFSQHV